MAGGYTVKSKTDLRTDLNSNTTKQIFPYPRLGQYQSNSSNEELNTDMAKNMVIL